MLIFFSLKLNILLSIAKTMNFLLAWQSCNLQKKNSHMYTGIALNSLKRIKKNDGNKVYRC